MTAFFGSGTLYAAIVLGMGIEALVLSLFYRRTGRGIAPAAFMLNLLAGMSLVLALRAAVLRDWWGWIALFLSAALVFHVLDLRRLWRRMKKVLG